MSANFGDRLTTAIHQKNAAVCVGLDPLLDRLPSSLLKENGIALGADAGSVDPARAAAALRAFGAEVIAKVAPLVPAIKINIAFFERYYHEGLRAYLDLVAVARRAGLLVIGDVKRADIGHSTTQYALAHLAPITSPEAGDIATPDAVTVNPYFGYDAIRPFVEIAKREGRGLFVLVQTSNESAEEVQGLTLADGELLCQKVARTVHQWSAGDDLVGSSGYSAIGAVVSPRDLESTKRIRTMMPNCIFLVPGFGAQGRTADEVAHCFKPDGSGAIVAASRSVIYAFDNDRYSDRHGDEWRAAIEHSCRDFVTSIREVISS